MFSKLLIKRLHSKISLRMLTSIFILFITCSYIYPINAQPQLRTGNTLDRIVAIVGSEIILQSTLDAQILLIAADDPSIDPNDENIRKKILDEIINRNILITKAEEDTISVSDELIEERWNIYYQELLNHFGSIERIESIYKKSINRIKLEVRDEIKKMLMSQQLEAKYLSDVAVTGKEIDNFYQVYKDSIMVLPTIPEQVELLHIVRYIHPDTTSKKNTYDLAKSIRDSIVAANCSFADAAMKYSADIATAKDGGDFGWAVKGKIVPELERAAYSLQKDEISLPVESPFGFHIIQLIEKEKDSVHFRHILFKLEQSDSDIEKVKNLLDSIKSVANVDNFAELALKFSEENETKGFSGSLGKFPIREFPPAIAATAKKLKDGETSSPEPYQLDPLKAGMHIILRKETFPEHRPNLEQDYNFIKRYATEYKRFNLRKELIAKLRKEVYWEILD